MPKILKAGHVKLDQGNKVNIEVMSSYQFPQPAPPPSPELDIPREVTERPPEKQAEDVLTQARNEANQIVRRAEGDAQKILEDAKAQSEKLAQDSVEKSRREGYEAGYAQAQAEAEGLKAQAQAALDDAHAERDAALQEVEPQAVHLIERILDKLLHDAVRFNPQIILVLLREGFAGATMTGEINIHISQEAYDTVIQNKNEILSLVDTSAKVEFVKDPSLNETDCIIETPFGNIDCSLDQQFELLKQDLHHILNHERT